MNELPDAREDGRCVDCEKETAATRCGRFCEKCLKQRIRHDNPIFKKGTFSDMRGRRSLPATTLGGSPDMRTTDELDEDPWDQGDY